MSNSNTNLQTQSSNALHNAIMEAGSKDRPPMLAPGNYVQWKSRIKRYIDTKPNRELIHYSLQNPPYIYQWAEKTVPVAEGSSETTIERYMENYKNVSQDIRDQMNAEAEAVQIILTGIDNDIYSTVDACPNACEMWKAIERLKQGESINVQDLETNLYWEFGKFTSRDGESLESYYSRFYKMMNELVRNQCNVTNHQVNVQFLLQLQPEWQRAFHVTLFGQDVDILQEQLLLQCRSTTKATDKLNLKKGSMTAFWVDTRLFNTLEIVVSTFRDSLLQHLGKCLRSPVVLIQTRHQRQYERRVNKRQMQTQKSKIDTGNALDADLVDTESIRTASTVHVTATVRENGIQMLTTTYMSTLKSLMEVGIVQYLKTCQIQEKVFAIAALKNDLKEVKRK
ncbi:hypothetical protein Tco_1391707 [Tanacetum coccineum]